MAAAWETIAFAFHSVGSHNQQNVAFATIWQILFLLSPLWVNAFVYMTFARMVHVYIPDRKVWIVKASQVSKLFVLADILSFIVQASGGILVSPGVSASTQEIGMHIYEGGIGLQEVFILCFIGLMIAFHLRINKLNKERPLQPEEVNLNSANGENRREVERPRGALALLYALYAVLAFITVRVLPIKLYKIPTDETFPCRCALFSDSSSFSAAAIPIPTPSLTTSTTFIPSTPSRCWRPCSSWL